MTTTPTTEQTAAPAELDLAGWCAETAADHRDYEDRELAMYPGDDRDRAIVEWVVRVLGNPKQADSRAVLAVLAERHGLALLSADEVDRLRADERNTIAADIEDMPINLGDAGWKHLEARAVEADYPAEWVRRRRSRDDFTTATIEVAYQYGYSQAAKVARKAATR
jgi:hypothetical protein